MDEEEEDTPAEQHPFDQQIEDAWYAIGYWTATDDEEQDDDDE